MRVRIQRVGRVALARALLQLSGSVAHLARGLLEPLTEGPFDAEASLLLDRAVAIQDLLS